MTRPNRPAYWGQGLPPPGAARHAPHPAWRAAWMIWSALWALFWITAGWFIFPVVNLLGFVASIAAVLAFDRMAPATSCPRLRRRGGASEPPTPEPPRAPWAPRRSRGPRTAAGTGPVADTAKEAGMHMKGRLAAAVAGGALLLSLGAIPAAAAPEPIKIYGRNVVALTSGTAKWTASAQGQDARNPKGEVTSLQGRAAVQETSGVKRVRIHDVTLQRSVAGQWQTVQQRLDDVADERTTAYAVAFTPQEGYCGFDESLTRQYRVVQHHSVRRVDGVASSIRTVVSKTFTARALWSDPACPKGAWNAMAWGAQDGDALPLGEPRDVELTFQYVSPTADPAQDVTLTAWFNDDMIVEAPAGWTHADQGEDAHNIFERSVASWPANAEEVSSSWTITPTNANVDWFISLTALVQAPLPSQTGTYFATGDVVEPPAEG